MPTNLSNHCRQRRRELGLKLGDVARRMGYGNVSRGANRLIRFEERGEIDPRVFPKLVAALEIDQETVDRLIEQDRREHFERWLAWVNEPVKPSLVVRLIPGIYSTVRIPAQLTTLEEMERYASDFARQHDKRVCLMPTRRFAVWLDANGNRERVQEATPGEAVGPWMQFGGSKRRFLFELGDGGIRLKPQ